MKLTRFEQAVKIAEEKLRPYCKQGGKIMNINKYLYYPETDRKDIAVWAEIILPYDSSGFNVILHINQYYCEDL